MSRFRLVLVAGVVVLLGYSLLHHGQRWTTYHDAKGGWTIDMPADSRVQPDAQGATIEGHGVQMTIFVLRRTSKPDTSLPLDPVAFLPDPKASGGGMTARAMTAVSRHRVFEIEAGTRGSGADDTAFRMLRSLRFD